MAAGQAFGFAASMPAVCNHPTRRPAKGSSRIKVIRGLNYRRPAGPWTCRCRLAIVTIA
jgi:hypothetical protein